jgi:hypothetical protein
MILRALTWQGQIIAPVGLSDQLSVSDLEGRHYELQAGGTTYVLAPFGPDAKGLLEAATGKSVEVSGLPLNVMSSYMRGPVLQVTSVK